MPQLLRSAIAILSGLITAALVVMGAESLNGRIYPLPPGIDLSDMDTMSQFVASLPASGFALVLVGWGAGALLGGWVSARVARRSPMAHAMVVAVLLLGGGVANMLMLPHPAWVWVAGILLFLLGGYTGGRLASRGLRIAEKESQFA